MKKRLTALLLAFALVFTLTAVIQPTVARADSHTFQDNSVYPPVLWTYEEADDHVVVKGFSCFIDVSYPSLTIPASINGKPVTEINHVFNAKDNIASVTVPSNVTIIGDQSFYGCSGIQNITIQGNVTSIGDYAFVMCPSLKTIGIPDTVKSIGSSAFANSGLESIDLPDGLTSLGDSAFSSCSSLKSVVLPGSLDTVNESLFNNCSSLQSVTISNGITGIEGSVFYGCAALESIHLPGSVTSVSPWAFTQCANLDSLSVDAGNPKYCAQDGVLYRKDKTTLVRYPPGKPGAFVVPNTVITLVDCAFEGSQKLSGVTIPSGVTSIGNQAFAGCTKLQSISLPSTVTSLGEAAFMGSSLTSISLPSSIQSIKRFTFAQCESLGSVSLPSALTDIGELAFMVCSGLGEITIPASVTSIGAYAFAGSDALSKCIYRGAPPAFGDLVFTSTVLKVYYPIGKSAEWAAYTAFPKQAYCFVTVHPQNGSASSQVMTDVVNGSIPAPAAPSTPTGYTFGGWYKEAACTNAWNFSTTLITDDISVYAKWTPHTYSVAYNGNGATGGATASSSHAYGTAKLLTANGYTKTGYTFIGWAKSPGGAVAYADKQSVMNLAATNGATVTLYAKWTLSKYAISVSANNTVYGSVSGGGSYAHGSTATVKATPKTGYRFVRWLEGSSAVSTSASYSFTVTKARTLKAEFAKIGTPASLKAVSTSYSSIKLTWAAVAGAAKYEVYRANASAGPYTRLTEVSSPTYTGTGLLTGKTYYYRVRAKCIASATTYGGYSAVVSAKPVLPTPASLKAASASYGSVKLTWGAVAGAGGYEVYRATASGGAYTKLMTTTAAGYTNNGLTTGKTYYYKVRAYRTVSGVKVYGGYSAIASAKPLLAAPGGVKAARVSNSSVKVSWAAVPGAGGYEVYRAIYMAGAYVKVGSIAGGATVSFTNTGLTDNRMYHFKVRAYRMVDSAKVYGAFSAIASATP